MNFVSYEFVFFLIAVWALFLAVPARFRATLLLAASYVFYATWSLPFVSVILLTTSIDYFASKLIFASTSPVRRKAALIGALVLNLFVLGFFKYCNFFLDASHSLVAMFGLKAQLPAHLDIILPLGISYYTFEAISYLVDTYRGARPSRSWLEYNFYIMYFPHLISGPIIRFNELLPQYREPLQVPSTSRVLKGIELILLGYAYKVVIANSCASIADPIFGAAANATPLQTYLAALAFTTQVYFDFMGYTHIARGVSLLFNIELPLNFNHPFTASNISNFWERWQISLTRWIRDYIFIPLGGTRKHFSRILLNLFIVMFVCGVWHGAGWRYVIWGAYYGLLVVGYYIYKVLRPKLFGSREGAILANPVYAIGSKTITFLAVMLACVIFRAPQTDTMLIMLNKMAQLGNLPVEVAITIAMHQFAIFATFGLLLTCCFAGPILERRYYQVMANLPYFFKVQLATTAACASWLLSAAGVQTFIYFKF